MAARWRGTCWMIIVWSLGISRIAWTQWIAPGELARPHEKLRGVTNCTKCHEFGRGPAVEKCLACHEPVAQDVRNRTGFHGRLPKDQVCWECHSEHRGRDYQLVRLDAETFDHRQTDFPLTGAHVDVACARCHRKARYLGTPTDCHACHAPKHGMRFGADCTGCHTTVAWSPVSFDHGQTRFPLRGAHVRVDCAKCHRQTLTQFKASVRFDDCIGCHRDPHRGQFRPQRCRDCHVETSFVEIPGFDHDRTRFPLTGAHRRLTCMRCHAGHRFRGTPLQCQGCHTNPHRRIRIPDCTRCHTTRTWTVQQFDHARTGFPLLGKHAMIACQECHRMGIRRKLATTCDGCHRSPHPRRVVAYRDCTACHMFDAWSVPTYDHRVSGFVLRGAHLDLQCRQCHTEERGGLHLPGRDCQLCHADPHRGAFGQDCTRCHAETVWTAVTFDHAQTKFPLTGRHLQVQCTQCHMPPGYRVRGIRCRDCHSDPHHGQFGQNCARCHSTEGWPPTAFDHTRTGFPLTGRHAEIACRACHTDWQTKLRPACDSCHTSPHEPTLRMACTDCHDPTGPWDQLKYTHERKDLFVFHTLIRCNQCHLQHRFTAASTNCTSCHTDYHEGAMGADCYRCHRWPAWRVVSFDHAETGFPLVGAHLALECGDCHRDVQTFRIIPRPMQCADCHEKHYRTATFPHARYGAGLNCQECHLQDKWQGAHSPFWFNLQTGTHAGIACAVCHKVAGDMFQYTCHDCHRGHAGDRGGRCLDCHIGGFEIEGEEGG